MDKLFADVAALAAPGSLFHFDFLHLDVLEGRIEAVGYDNTAKVSVGIMSALGTFLAVNLLVLCIFASAHCVSCSVCSALYSLYCTSCNQVYVLSISTVLVDRALVLMDIALHGVKNQHAAVYCKRRNNNHTRALFSAEQSYL